MPAPPLPRRFWIAYWGLWTLAGLSLALAAWQDPNQRPGRAAWEPFVLEISSLLASGLLALLVYRWVAWLGGRPWPLQLLAHSLGALLFAVAHLALMHALRWPFYWLLAGRFYAPLPALQALGFEGAKDAVTYLVIAALSWAWLLRQREQAQREQLARAEQLQTELRLAQWSQRLQPHFLFNSLNTLAALVEERPRAAVSMIARLGALLRRTLEAPATPSAALTEELEIVGDYLAIQALRFDGALQFELDVEPASAALVVPRLLLLPLVENAVKHSMVLPETPLRLRLRAWRDGELLRLSLSNSPARGRDGGTGLGLGLVEERLRLLAGSAAGLRAQAEGDAYLVELWLPAHE